MISSQLTVAVICINRVKVMIAPNVTTNPVYPSKKKAKENNIDFVFRGINENDIVVIGDIISSTHQTTLFQTRCWAYWN